MKTSNTRNVTGLYIASGKNDPLHIGGTIGGKAQRICSLPAHLNNREVPNARELRGIIEGRSIVAAAPWTAVDGTAFDAIGFAVTSAHTAFDTVNEFDSIIAAVAAHRENVIDTLRENDRSHLRAKALEAFDACTAKLSPLFAMEGVTVERDSTAGDNGGLVDVERVMVDGAVIGHVFAAANRGRVQFKAQANGGALVAWSDDFTGAARLLAAHSRMASPATDYSAAMDMVDAATALTAGAEHGAALAVINGAQGNEFVMWTATHRHALLCAATDQARLNAHWEGFVQTAARIAELQHEMQGEIPDGSTWAGTEQAEELAALMAVKNKWSDADGDHTLSSMEACAPVMFNAAAAVPIPAPVVFGVPAESRTNRDIMEAHRRTLQQQREAREREAVEGVPGMYAVRVEARRAVRAYAGAVVRIAVASYTVNLTDDDKQAEACRAAAETAIDRYSYAPDADTVIHSFMAGVHAGMPGAALVWSVVVAFN